MCPAGDRPRIGVTYFSEGGNPVKRELFERVRRWADLTVLDPFERHPEIVDMDLDLFHMARWSTAAYWDFEQADAAGVATINSYAGTRRTEDRVRKARACRERGLPFPEFEYGRAEEITLDPPVLVKPRHETAPDGHEFRLVYKGAIAFEGRRLVQRYVVPTRSFKLFHVGEHVRVTELFREDPPEEIPVARRLADLAADVADLFDLVLFELDAVVHKNYYVVDVNPVVSLAGVEDGPEIYEELLRTACENA